MSVTPSPIGGFAAQFFDNNGVILSGGKIYTYAAGTTTPQASYTSAAGVTPHANPIILDSAGRVPGGEIWLTDGLVYKFVIETAASILIGTYDNITGVNSNFVNYTVQEEVITATAGQTVFNLSTINYTPGTNSLTVYIDGVNQYVGDSYLETDSDTVTFTSGVHVGGEVKFTTAVQTTTGAVDASIVSYEPPFANSVATNVEAKLAQYVSVKDFGAVGDGVTDDAAAINAGANALQALGGGTLGFPRGDYYIASNTVTIPKYVEVKADADAVLIQSSAATGTAMVIEGRPFSETIRRPRIHVLPSIQKGAAGGQPLWNTGADTSSIGLHIDGCSDDTFFLRAVAYFYNGVLMNSNFPAPAPNNTLCVNNTVNLGNIRNCYKGLWLENGANSNTFIQGVINVDNAWITAGTTHITLKGAESNTNTFVGTNLEGPSNVNLKAVEVESIANLFNNCRIEKLTAGALRFTSTSNTNIWIGGSDKASSVSQGYFDAVVSDSGFGNTFQWGGTYSGRHVTIDNGAGTDRQGIGFSSGSFPAAWISAYAANRLWLKGTTAAPLQGVRYQGCMNQEKLTITSGTNWLNKNANIIVADYAAPQSISTFGNVGALSDVNALATIMDLNGNITLVHTASPASGAAKFVLKAGVNLLLTANQPVQFMSHDGNWYQL
jgi:hypothetical protein